MKIRIKLDSSKIKKLLEYSGDFIELVYTNKLLVLCSETVESTVMTQLIVLDNSNEDASIRIPKDVLKHISVEEVMDLIVNDSSIECIFYNSEMRFLYKISVSKQRSFISVEDKLEIMQNSDSFSKHNIGSLSGIVKTVSRLNSNLMCVNGILTCEYNRSYIFMKADLPNFYIQGKLLRKLMSISSDAIFAGKYIYSYDETYDLHVFLNKLRVTEISDIEFIRNKKYSHNIKVDTQAIMQLSKRFTIDNNSDIVLDLVKGQIDITEEYRSFSVNTPVLNVVTGNKTDESINEVNNLLNSLDSESKLDLNDLSNPNNLPRLKLPKWVIMSAINRKVTSILLNKNFICMSVEGGKILLPRSDA